MKLQRQKQLVKHMTSRKASGPIGAVAEMLKTECECCLESLTRIFNDVLFENTLLGDWMLSSLVPI